MTLIGINKMYEDLKRAGLLGSRAGRALKEEYMDYITDSHQEYNKHWFTNRMLEVTEQLGNRKIKVSWTVIPFHLDYRTIDDFLRHMEKVGYYVIDCYVEDSDSNKTEHLTFLKEWKKDRRSKSEMQKLQEALYEIR